MNLPPYPVMNNTPQIQNQTYLVQQQVPVVQPMYQAQPLMPEVVPYQLPVIVTNLTILQDKLLSCEDICCRCYEPKFQCCQCCIGLITALSLGEGLVFGTCFGCYGCDRQDCCSVCCAGIGMTLSSPFIYGIVSSCVVGFKMIC